MLVNSIKVTENIKTIFLINYQYYVHPRLIYFQLLEVSRLTLYQHSFEKLKFKTEEILHTMLKDAAVVKKVFKTLQGLNSLIKVGKLNLWPSRYFTKITIYFSWIRFYYWILSLNKPPHSLCLYLFSLRLCFSFLLTDGQTSTDLDVIVASPNCPVHVCYAFTLHSLTLIVSTVLLYFTFNASMPLLSTIVFLTHSCCVLCFWCIMTNIFAINVSMSFQRCS